VVALFSPLSLRQFPDVDGKPHLGARLFLYATGTTTPLNVYRTAALDPTQMLPWPIPVDGNGYSPAIFVGQGNYDVIVTDGQSLSPPGAVLLSADNLPGDPAPVASPVFDPERQIATGAYGFFAGSGGIDGWVPANGGAIGNAISQASTRANEDCLALFTFLWERRSDLDVTPQRGLTAAADFEAGVTVTLPDLSSRLLAFAADGSGAGNLFSGGLITRNPGSLIGIAGGEATHVLTANELATHAHLAHFAGDPVGDHKHVAGSGIDTPSHLHTNGVIRKLVNSASASSGSLPVSFYAFPDGEGVGASTLTSYPDVNHTHSIAVQPAGAFTPSGSVSIDPTGLSAAHNNLPPFEVAGAVYIKL
jgi:hypothetical protein